MCHIFLCCVRDLRTAYTCCFLVSYAPCVHNNNICLTLPLWHYKLMGCGETDVSNGVGAATLHSMHCRLLCLEAILHTEYFTV